MQIDLPKDVIDRVRERTRKCGSLTEADVIRSALDSLDWQDGERLAICEGIEAMKAGRVRDFDQFDQDFRSANAISKQA